MISHPPYSVLADLGSIPDQGLERTLSPTAEERQAIARWLGVESLEHLEANVRVKRRGEDHYSYEARFDAPVVQSCVVTLAPVSSRLEGEFRRDFRVRPKPSSKRRRASDNDAPSVELTGLEDDEAEWLEEPVIDLAAPVLEELTLALDPYPRAPGAAFEAPPEEKTVEDSPFAVLEKLRTAVPAGSPAKKPENGPDPGRQGKKKR